LHPQSLLLTHRHLTIMKSAKHVVWYVSGHGFGHASRDSEVISTLASQRPDTRFSVRTGLPQWLFKTTRASLDVQSCQTDTGVTQVDSLHLDEDETARRAAAFYNDFDRRVDEEAAYLREARPNLVVGDIPPLAFAAASRAGIPSVAIGNFTWDWIYAAYPSFDRIAPNVVATLVRAYADASCALRLPLHGGFQSMASVTTDIPFVARRSARDPEGTRRTLGVPPDRPMVFASFGAYGAALPLDALKRSHALTVVTLDRPPQGLLYQDIVAAADVVVSKPGYGIVSECIANDTALLYTSRGRFVEYDVFVAQMPHLLRCRYISNDDLFAGRWEDAIEALLSQPTPHERPRVDGAQVAAGEIMKWLGE
jgi:L-arabinokinase